MAPTCSPFSSLIAYSAVSSNSLAFCVTNMRSISSSFDTRGSFRMSDHRVVRSRVMPDLTDVIADLRAEDDALLVVLEGLTPEQWDQASPAQGWTIRDQVSHLADTNELCID